MSSRCFLLRSKDLSKLIGDLALEQWCMQMNRPKLRNSSQAQCDLFLFTSWLAKCTFLTYELGEMVCLLVLARILGNHQAENLDGPRRPETMQRFFRYV